MKYSFFMNADDYTKAFLYKLEVCKLNDKTPIIVVFLCLIALICLTLLQKSYLGVIYFVLLLISLFFIQNLKRKSIKKQFFQSPVLRGRHTLCIYDEGLEIINSYEKIFTPWESIYHFKEDDKKVILLPTFRKGVLVINKDNTDKEQLELFLNDLRHRLSCREGSK